MIDKLGQMKDLYALKKQADALKKEMQNIQVEVFEGDYRIIMLGDQTVVAVYKDGEEKPELKKLYNKALKESQKKVAKQMRGKMGDLGLPGF